MNALKIMLEKGKDENDLADYIESQIAADILSGEEFDALVQGLADQPDQLAPLLGFYGITNSDQIETVSKCLQLFLGGDDDSAGQSGDNTDAQSHVAVDDPSVQK